MANFQIFESKEDISEFDLPLGREVKLLQYGGDDDRNAMELALYPSTVKDIALTQLKDKLEAASTAFTVKGTTPGAKGEVASYVATSKQTARYGPTLALKVFFAPAKHTGYDVDLVSDLAIKGDGEQILLYTRLLNGMAKGIAQDLKKPQLDCGDVAKDYGKLFKMPVSTNYFPYYLPAKNNKHADLRFEPKAMAAAVAKIKTLLDKGTLVRVWCIHGDGFTFPTIQDRRQDTHFITIAGYSASKFLYVDPLPGASKMGYSGAMYPWTKSVPHLGELEFDATSPQLGIRSVAPMTMDPATASSLSPHLIATMAATFKYTIIAGP